MQNAILSISLPQVMLGMLQLKIQMERLLHKLIKLIMPKIGSLAPNLTVKQNSANNAKPFLTILHSIVKTIKAELLCCNFYF